MPAIDVPHGETSVKHKKLYVNQRIVAVDLYDSPPRAWCGHASQTGGTQVSPSNSTGSSSLFVFNACFALALLL